MSAGVQPHFFSLYSAQDLSARMVLLMLTVGFPSSVNSISNLEGAVLPGCFPCVSKSHQVDWRVTIPAVLGRF